MFTIWRWGIIVRKIPYTIIVIINHHQKLYSREETIRCSHITGIIVLSKTFVNWRWQFFIFFKFNNMHHRLFVLLIPILYISYFLQFHRLQNHSRGSNSNSDGEFEMYSRLLNLSNMFLVSSSRCLGFHFLTNRKFSSWTKWRIVECIWRLFFFFFKKWLPEIFLFRCICRIPHIRSILHVWIFQDCTSPYIKHLNIYKNLDFKELYSVFFYFLSLRNYRSELYTLPDNHHA